MRSEHSPSARAACITLICAMLVAVSGCNIVGPAFYFIHGPEKTSAAFTLPRNRSTVVFVDDQNSVLPRRTLRLEIAASATEVIQNEKLVDDVIDGRGAILAATRDRDSEPMSVVAVGRAVKAEVVIYLIIDGFTLSAGGGNYSPIASARVKVIDAQNDVRLWPGPDVEAGAPLRVTMFEKPGYQPTSGSQIVQAENELAKEVGVALAELFFSHEKKRPNRR